MYTRFRSSLMDTVATLGLAGNALSKLPLGVLLDKATLNPAP